MTAQNEIDNAAFHIQDIAKAPRRCEFIVGWRHPRQHWVGDLLVVPFACLSRRQRGDRHLTALKPYQPCLSDCNRVSRLRLLFRLPQAQSRQLRLRALLRPSVGWSEREDGLWVATILDRHRCGFPYVARLFLDPESRRSSVKILPFVALAAALVSSGAAFATEQTVTLNVANATCELCGLS